MAKRKTKKRNPQQKVKKETNDWCSRYIRIKAAIEFADEFITVLANDLLGRCYTCARIVNVIHNDAGHFKSRGIGGSSGLYFDERAIRLQCKSPCNGFEQGRPKEFREHLVEEYGEAMVQELERIHLVKTYTYKEIIGLGLYFKAEVEKMCQEHSIRPWW